jgi:endoribonuclease Dicer
MLQISTCENYPANGNKVECDPLSLDPRVTPCYNTSKNQDSDSGVCLDSHTSASSQSSNGTVFDDCIDYSHTQSPPIVSDQNPVRDSAHIDHLLHQNSPPSTPRLQNRHCPSNMEVPFESASLAPAQSTVIAQRSTLDVISDLKRNRHHPNGSPREPSRGVATNLDNHSISLLPDQAVSEVNVPAADVLISLEDESEDEDSEDEDDEPEGEETTTRPKKVTERKRRLNAIADSWVQTSLLNPTVKNNQVTADEEGSQSTKWLVNQAEDRVISTPREYQIELYERAKEKNIIAVLDTGELVNF